MIKLLIHRHSLRVNEAIEIPDNGVLDDNEPAVKFYENTKIRKA